MLPLKGVKVLELGTVMMAPYAGQWLADLGADVVKVEAPAGDSTRRTGPAAEEDMAAVYLSLNRNKRAIVLDLKTPEGLEALVRLSDQADVLLHNNRPQKMSQLGLGADFLRARNPRLVYASLHGFGEKGPYKGKPAYDDIIQGLCGMADLMLQQTGVPRYLPTVVADKTAGLFAVISVLAALHLRGNTGVGSHVEVPMFESMVAFTAVEHLFGHQFEPDKGPAYYPRVISPERAPFATADGFICVLPYTDKHWARVFEACGRQDLAADARFRGIADRTEHSTALYAELRSMLITRSTAEWLELFDLLEVPCGPIKSLAALIDDPHLIATHFFAKIETSAGDTLRFAGVPVSFDGERPPVAMPPRLGEHTGEVLREAGFGETEIERLSAAVPSRAKGIL